jgi:hypothetical protein
VVAGFAGGLSAELRVGDLVLASEVVDEAGKRWVCVGDIKSVPVSRGVILSTPEVISDPARKARLGEVRDALAVEMEAAALARVCAEEGVPFACLRAISDTRDTPLPADLLGCLEGERVRAGRLLRALGRRPGLAWDLFSLARDSGRAADRLCTGLMDLLLNRQEQVPVP